MKRRNIMAIVVTAMIGMGIISAQAAEKKPEPKKQTTCPVMGGKINKAQYADVNGKRIYVCCPGCIGKIKAAPDKYIKLLEDKGIVLDETPKAGKNESEKKSNSHAGHHH